MKAQYVPYAALTAFAMLLSGCEKPVGTEKAETVVTVAGNAISKAELDLAVSRLGDLNDAQRAEAQSKLLQLLVDQQLVVEAAKKAGLDKEPAVALAMAQASRQVLAEAYAERATKELAKPTESEAAEYYAQHPELFAQRRIYRIQELELKVEPARMADVEAKLKSSQSLGDFVNWVKEQGIEGKTATTVKPAEQIPAPLLAQLSQMRDGQVTVVPARPGYVVILQLQESQQQPVSLEQAKSAIERALVAQKRKAQLEAEVKTLRETTKIEYASGYAPATETKAVEQKAESDKADEKPAAN